MHQEQISQIGEIFDWLYHHPKGKFKVLLREKEFCPECGKYYLSLYPLRFCVDHDGLDEDGV